jgi:hypothetical protein
MLFGLRDSDSSRSDRFEQFGIVHDDYTETGPQHLEKAHQRTRLITFSQPRCRVLISVKERMLKAPSLATGASLRSLQNQGDYRLNLDTVWYRGYREPVLIVGYVLPEAE